MYWSVTKLPFSRLSRSTLERNAAPLQVFRTIRVKDQIFTITEYLTKLEQRILDKTSHGDVSGVLVRT